MNINVNDRRAMSLFLIGAGVLLIGFWQYGIGLVWPLFIVGPGAMLLYHAFNSEDVDVIFPGVILTGTGLLLFYQSLTGHWASWAYAWAIYPALTGYAMQWRAVRLKKYRHEYVMGRAMLRYGTMALIGLAVLFEFAIFQNGSAQIAGLVMIAAGILLFVSHDRSPRPAVDFNDLMKPKND